uniref:Transposase n=1 Tax=Cacopsylla melanoneura TaxID=428564 RepID=A0A8D8Z5S1_9HEMI
MFLHCGTKFGTFIHYSNGEDLSWYLLVFAGQMYADFIEHILPDLLDQVPLEVRRGMWFQQDGAPPHFSRIAREKVNEMFLNRWIGRGGPENWPPRSPDLTPLDYFLWGFIKEQVMATAPTTPENMKRRIIAAVRKITPQMLARVRQSFRHRLVKCIEVQGAQFEHLMK